MEKMHSWKQFVASLAVVITSLLTSLLVIRWTSDYFAKMIVDLYQRAFTGLATLWLLSAAIGFVLSRSIPYMRDSSRKIVVWCGILSALPSVLFYSHVPPLNRGAQKRTMADIRVISNSLEIIRSKNGIYPIAQTIQSIESQSGISLPKKDGWGTPFLLRSSTSSYAIISRGSDGKPDSIEPSGATTKFTNDIVFKNGEFTSYPEGIQH